MNNYPFQQQMPQMPFNLEQNQIPNSIPVTGYFPRPQITIESVRPIQGRTGLMDCHQVCYKVCVGSVCYRECIEVC
ncbi:hypothetical protein [Lysinibacillus fusiformis]|uniref:hypothetical protein n=1 Tax=Lysinibacillus fusiformis TaxID=28031 RepID=UPI002E21B32D|nr:hypothetical protein [Lysinibacillus fusiformis]